MLASIVDHIHFDKYPYPIRILCQLSLEVINKLHCAFGLEKYLKAFSGISMHKSLSKILELNFKKSLNWQGKNTKNVEIDNYVAQIGQTLAASL